MKKQIMAKNEYSLFKSYLLNRNGLFPVFHDGDKTSVKTVSSVMTKKIKSKQILLLILILLCYFVMLI